MSNFGKNNALRSKRPEAKGLRFTKTGKVVSRRGDKTTFHVKGYIGISRDAKKAPG